MMIRKDKMFFLHYHLPASLFFAARNYFIAFHYGTYIGWMQRKKSVTILRKMKIPAQQLRVPSEKRKASAPMQTHQDVSVYPFW